MEVEERKKSPYSGFLVICFFLIIVPAILFLIIFLSLQRFQAKFGYEQNLCSALFLGCGLGFIFHLSCFIAGVFKAPISAVKLRMVEFKENLFLSFKFAIKNYFLDIKENGCTFLVYFLIICANFLVTLFSLLNFLTNYL